MSYYSDKDIRKALGKDIVIDPFTEESLTPIGYDFRVGSYVFSLEHGLLEARAGSYALPAKSTVQILTREALWVSSRLAGTFHSKVSLVSKGLSHVSTTLDPQWYGPLLITLRNNTDKPISIREGDEFVTLVFSRVRTPTRLPHRKDPYRSDIMLLQLLDGQTGEYVQKITAVLTDDGAKARFKEQVQAANRPMIDKVKASARSRSKEEVRQVLLVGAVCTGVIVLASLSKIWPIVSPSFRHIPYDSKVFASQTGGIIALLGLLVSVSRKRD